MSKARDLADGTFDTDLTVSGANPNIDVADTGTSHASQDFLSNSSAVRATIGVEQSAGGGLFVGSSGYAAVFGTASSGSTEFATNNNVRMAIDSAGNVKVSNGVIYLDDNGSHNGIINAPASLFVNIDSDNTSSGEDFIIGSDRTSTSGGKELLRMSGGEALTLTNTKTGVTSSAMVFSNTQASGAYRVRFDANSSIIGDIRVTTSSVAYNTTSDARLKENVVDLTGAIDRVNQIPVHRFNFIANPDTTVDGFLAHEVQDIVPEAITGTHNEVDEDGNPVYQGIDQSKLVPLLTAALQEALSEIADLKTRVAALETP
jgi:hypothetical protein